MVDVLQSDSAISSSSSTVAVVSTEAGTGDGVIHVGNCGGDGGGGVTGEMLLDEATVGIDNAANSAALKIF